MDRFSSVLRRVDRRLQAPEPQRSRILMEMAGDLEDLYRAYRERGLDEAEAARAAERWLAPSGSAIEALQSVHLPAFDRLLDRLGGTTRGRIELGLATLVSLAASAGGVLGILRSGTLTPSAPGLWIVAAVVAAGVCTAVWQGYALFVRGDRLGTGWRRKLGRVLASAVGAALAGLVAGAVRLTLTVDPPAGAAVGAGAAFWSQIGAAAGVAASGLTGALLLALSWLLLRARAGDVVRARSELREELGLGEAGLATRHERAGGRPATEFDERTEPHGEGRS